MSLLNDPVTGDIRELAEFVWKTRFEDIPAEIVERAKLIIYDNFGVALASSVAPEQIGLARHLNTGMQQATLLCRDFIRSDVKSAAFFNAAEMCRLELDEGCRPAGHPALNVLPAVLAFSQMKDLSGKEFLLALILGYDVQYRLSNAARLRKSVHPHGVFGNISATVAIGKLAHWDVEKIITGISCAASICIAADFQTCYSGDTVRNTYPAFAAQNALTVYQLIESGFTGRQGALSGTFTELLGESFNSSALTKDLGVDYGMAHNYFKFHPCCAYNHPSLDAVMDAVGIKWEHGNYPPFRLMRTFLPDEIDHIHFRTTGNGMKLNCKAGPRQLSAKFSVPFSTAALLLFGFSCLDHFCDRLPEDADINAVEDLVIMEEDESYNEAWPEKGMTSVDIVLKDGSVLHGMCSDPYGSAGNPPLMDDLDAKFKELAGHALSSEACSKLRDRIFNIENISVNSLFEPC